MCRTLRTTRRTAIFGGIAIAVGCATNRNAEQASIPSGSWPVETQQHWLKHTLQFGGYRTSSIDPIMWHGGGFDADLGKIDWTSVNSNTKFAFDLMTPDGTALRTSLEVKFTNDTVKLASIRTKHEIHSIVRGSMTADDGRVWRIEYQDLIPTTDRLHSARGMIQLPSGGELQVSLAPDAAYSNSTLGRIFAPTVIEFLNGSRRIGRLDGIRQPTIWIDPAVPDETRHAIAASCVTLIDLDRSHDSMSD